MQLIKYVIPIEDMYDDYYYLLSLKKDVTYTVINQDKDFFTIIDELGIKNTYNKSFYKDGNEFKYICES